MSDATLPKTMRIRGGATTSKVSGNRWWFSIDGLKSLLTEKAQAPYVADHGMDLKDVAGHVERIFIVEEGTIEVPIINGPRKGQKKPWQYMTIGHESTLSSEYPAYATVASYILATSRSGKVPQESISMQIAGLDFDEETEQVILRGPFRLSHHSSVSRGAFGPDAGVGVTSIEFSADGNASLNSFAIAPPTSASFHIANLEEAIVSFRATHESNPRALAAISSELAAPQPPTQAASFAAGEFNTPEILHDSGDALLADPPTNPASKPAADAVTLSAEAFAALKADASKGSEALRIVTELKEAQAAQARVTLDSERERIMANYGTPKEDVLACADIASLRALENAERRNGTKRTPASPEAKVADERAASIAAHNKSLDEGRDEFIKSITLRAV